MPRRSKAVLDFRFGDGYLWFASCNQGGAISNQQAISNLMFRLSGGLKSHESRKQFSQSGRQFQLPGLPFRYIIRCQTVRRGGKFQVVAVCRCGRLWRSVWSMTLLYFHGKILDRERTHRLFGLLPPLRLRPLPFRLRLISSSLPFPPLGRSAFDVGVDIFVQSGQCASCFW